jgi:hypothetical protein
VQSVLDEIDNDLRNIPDPPANALFTVNHVLIDFHQAFRKRIDGEKQPNDLSKAWKEIKKTFFNEIVELQRPNLIVSESLQNRQTTSQVICLDSDLDDDVPPPITPSPPKKRRGARGAIPTSFASPGAPVLSVIGKKKRSHVENGIYSF